MVLGKSQENMYGDSEKDDEEVLEDEQFEQEEKALEDEFYAI